MEEKQLGQYLKTLRKTYAYTQEYVASHLDVSRQAYSHYETNRAMPSNDAIFKIASLYGISVDSLIEKSLVTDPGIEYAVPVDDSKEQLYEFLNDEKNALKLKNLSRKEKELLFFFENISEKDQDEILAFLKIKLHHNF